MSYKFFFFACALNLFYYVPNLLASPVIGGDEDRFHTYTYHVSIIEGYDHRIPNSGKLLCGGTIIDARYVLTAAHCFMIKRNGNTQKILEPTTSGVVVIAGTSETYGPGIIMYIHKVFIPHAYDLGQRPEEIYGDIAVVELVFDLNLARNGDILQILPLDPGRHFNVYEKKEAFVPGNGCDVLDIGHDGRLRPQPHRFANRRQVLKVYMDERNRCPFFDHSICAINLDRSQIRACANGDSGSPLVHEHTVIGVLSNTPTVYQGHRNNRKAMLFTRVWTFIVFIRNAINEYGDHTQMHTLVSLKYGFEF